MTQGTKRNPASPRRSTLIMGATALALVLLIVVVLSEVMLRVVMWHSMDFDIEMWKYAAKLKQPSVNKLTGHEHRPNSHAFLMGAEVTINSAGYRDREYPLEKKPGAYRIIAAGDSLTFGWGVKQSETYPKVLESELNRGLKPGAPIQEYEVINTGIGNMNTTQEFNLFKDYGQRFHPDMVILGYFINDAEPVQHHSRGFLRENSYAYIFFLSRFDNLLRTASVRGNYLDYYSGLYSPERKGWLDTQQSLRNFAKLCRDNNSRFCIAILPELHDLSERYPFQQAHDAVKRIAEEERVPCIDLLPKLREGRPEASLWVSPADAHPNARACRLIAEGLFEMVKSPP